jgi:hypothetical protein
MCAFTRLLLMLLPALLACAGCGPTVDLTKGLELAVLGTGWFDAGIVNGQSKLVPTVSFTLKNVSDQRLGTLQVNAVFRHVNEDDDWGSGFLTAVGSEGLVPGATTATLTIKSPLGYTGRDQTRLEMLANTHFVDVRVELFAKYASTQWVRVGLVPIARELLTK